MELGDGLGRRIIAFGHRLHEFGWGDQVQSERLGHIDEDAFGGAHRGAGK